MTRPHPDELFIDACPDCDRRNPTVPLVVVTVTGRCVRCVYECETHGRWTCSWAWPEGWTQGGQDVREPVK